MDFITENYLWFIVGGVILVMALIGYIAEKTDFGRKEKTKKPKEDRKEEKNVETTANEPVSAPVPDADNMDLNQTNSEDDASVDEPTDSVVPDAGDMVSNQNETQDNDVSPEPADNNENIQEDLTVPLGSLANDDTTAKGLPTEEDLTVPLEPAATNGEDSALQEEQTNEEVSEPQDEKANEEELEPNNEIFKPLEEESTPEEPASVDEVVADEPSDEAEKDEPKDNVDLPDIDKLKDNNPDEEDVWRF